MLYQGRVKEKKASRRSGLDPKGRPTIRTTRHEENDSQERAPTHCRRSIYSAV